MSRHFVFSSGQTDIAHMDDITNITEVKYSRSPAVWSLLAGYRTIPLKLTAKTA